MKILYLHRTQGQGVEGVHIRGIVDAARERGCEVRVIGPADTDPHALERPTGNGKPGLAARFARGAPELLFELAEMAYDRRLALRLKTELAGFSPDLIYERYAFFAETGSKLAARLGLPHVIEVNYTCSDPLVRKRSRLLMPAALRLEERIFGRAAVLASVSSRLDERLADRGVPSERIAFTPNAVRGDWLAQAGSLIPAELPGGCADAPVVGFVGGFYPWHGLDRLVEAAGRAKEAGLPCSLLLVGDGPERPRIEARIQAAGLAERACLPGAIAHDELPRWIAAMDICVMPHSNDYGSPMKVFEYMGLGRSVLAPDLPPLADVIDSGVNGLLFSCDRNAADPAGPLAASLIELLGDADLRIRMGAAARERTAREHTWQANLDRIFAKLDIEAPPAPFVEMAEAMR